jgi:hypothetical protein
MKTYNPPVSIQVYLGSGKRAEKLRENINRERGKDSLSEFIVTLLKKADPKLFKGIENGQD